MVFHLDGKVINNLDELLEELIIMDESVFRRHVNREKNDFYNWIRIVLKDHALAHRIRDLKTKEGIILEIENKLTDEFSFEDPEEKKPVENKITDSISSAENQPQKVVQERPVSHHFTQPIRMSRSGESRKIFHLTGQEKPIAVNHDIKRPVRDQRIVQDQTSKDSQKTIAMIKIEQEKKDIDCEKERIRKYIEDIDKREERLRMQEKEHITQEISLEKQQDDDIAREKVLEQEEDRIDKLEIDMEGKKLNDLENKYRYIKHFEKGTKKKPFLNKLSKYFNKEKQEDVQPKAS